MWVMLAFIVLFTAILCHRTLDVSAGRILGSALRALVQLVIVALLISQVSTSWPLTLAFLALMLCVATWTCTRRIAKLRWWVPALGMSVAVGPVALIMLLCGVLPFSPLAIIAVIGQLIGGAMSATNLTGRRLHQELELRAGEVEAALSLGFTRPVARNLVSRPVAAEALLPGLDQTRTAGTVTLPGAFVGLVLGGASPLEAGLVQLVVLINLLAVQAIAITVISRFIDHEWGSKPHKIHDSDSKAKSRHR